MLRNKRLVLCAFTVLCIVFTFTLKSHATNGLRIIGNTPITLGLGGAGVAKPTTADAMYLNPAGMNDIANMADLSFLVGLPGIQMGSSNAAIGNPSAVSVDAVNDGILLPGVGAIFNAFSDKLAFGIGTFLTSGFQVEYPVSRLPSALTSNLYDTSGRYANFKIIPAASYKILDNLSIGIGLDINYAFLNTDSAVTLPGFPETAGRNRFDPALGIGGRVGIQYQPIDMLSIGVVYSTRSYFNRFNRYRDLLKDSLDLPMELALGVAVMPIEGAMFVGDFRWIDYSSINVLGDKVTDGGLQWRDQYVMALGFQYSFLPKFSIPLTARMGYNYGQSPIVGAGAFQNINAPLVMQHHLSGGLSMELGEHIGLDAVYAREFSNTVTDDGTANPLAAGSFVKASAHVFGIGLRARWGQKGE